MNLQQAKNLKIDDSIFHEYEKSKVKSELFVDWGNGNERIDILKASGLQLAHIGEIFLPTEHVEKVSNMVAEKRKEFDEKRCIGTNINPNIFVLFKFHWTNMCNVDGNEVQYQLNKAFFEAFIKELFEVVNVINNITVMGIPYLRR